MPQPAASLLVFALAAVLALSLSACGEEDAELLPGETAREITANLDTVQRLADEGDCAGAEGAALQVSEQVESLQGVDARLERALRQGADRLEEVVARCEEEEAVEVAPLPEEEESDPEELEEEDEEQEQEEEKEQKAEEREAEREAEQEASREEGGEEDEGERSLPPQAKGEGKGLGDGNGSGGGGEGGGTPSGGLGPSNPVDEG